MKLIVFQFLSFALCLSSTNICCPPNVSRQLWQGEETRRSRAGLCILWYDERGPLLTMWEFIFLTSPPPRYSFPPSCSVFISAFTPSWGQYGLVLLLTDSQQRSVHNLKFLGFSWRFILSSKLSSLWHNRLHFPWICFILDSALKI